jgi:hypothetical protein
MPEKMHKDTEIVERSSVHGNRPPRSSWICALYLLPAFFTAAYIAAYGVNVPVLDEWGLPYMYNLLKVGTRNFALVFWPLDNEHRVVIPKLIWAAVAFPTHWNLVFNMSLTFGVMLATFVWMVRFARREHVGSKNRLHAALIASGMLLFSFVHWDTWLFSWQLTFILAICCAISAILVLVSPKLRPSVRLWVAIAFCFLSTFSASQGILAWLVILPAVFLAFPSRRQSIVACVSVLVCFGLTMGIYYIDYHPNGLFRPDPFLILRRPGQVFLFWVALIGAPLAQAFSFTTLMAQCLGATSLAVFAVAVLASIRAGLVRNALGWILIGIYGISADIMIAVARAGWGVGVASTQSRYMDTAVLIQVATLLLLAGLVPRIKAWEPFFWVGTVAIIGLELASYPGGIEKGRQLRDSRTLAAQSLQVMPYIDPATDQSEQGLLFPLFYVVTPVSYVRTPAELLYKTGLRWIEHNAVFDEHPPFCGCLDAPILKAGEPFALAKSEPLPVSGWALYPGKPTLPKAVFFSTDDRRLFIFGATVGNSFSRPDVARLMRNPALVRSEWSTAIPAAFLPKGEFELKAWVYDREHSRFLRLADCNGPKLINRFF